MRFAKNGTHICRRGSSGSGPKGGTNGSLQNIKPMLLKMRRIGTCDDALPREVGCTPPGLAVVGYCRGSEGWTSRIGQKTLLSRVDHRHSPSAVRPFSGWGHPPAKYTREDDERVPNTGTGTYVSLTMGTAHANGLGLIALVKRCPAWVGRGRVVCLP